MRPLAILNTHGFSHSRTYINTPKETKEDRRTPIDKQTRAGSLYIGICLCICCQLWCNKMIVPDIMIAFLIRKRTLYFFRFPFTCYIFFLYIYPFQKTMHRSKFYILYEKVSLWSRSGSLNQNLQILSKDVFHEQMTAEYILQTQITFYGKFTVHSLVISVYVTRTFISPRQSYNGCNCFTH